MTENQKLNMIKQERNLRLKYSKMMKFTTKTKGMKAAANRIKQ